MNIGTFYTNVLGADLRNPRWSWGSVDPVTNRVFLRVWQDEIRDIDGGEYVRLLRSEPRLRSSGYAEREGHIARIAEGAEGYGVVCTARDPSTTGPRTIKSFDSETLLEFGEILKVDEDTVARVAGRVATRDLQRRRTASTTLSSDLKAILRQREGPTAKEVLLSARIGQGRFRTQVLKLWGGRCAVTGVGILDALRASHIKPWRACTDVERLDPWNGIPLVATYDALFDAGLITFGEDGAVAISSWVSSEDRPRLCLLGSKLRRRLDSRTLEYLRYHAEFVFH